MARCNRGIKGFPDGICNFNPLTGEPNVKGREKERVRDVKVAIKTREKTGAGTPTK